MNASFPWVIWAILLPLAAACLSFVLRSQRAFWVGFVTALGNLLIAAGLGHQLSEEGPLRYRIGGWGAPLGIDLYVDGLAVVMILMTSVVGLVTTIYAAGYFSIGHGAHGTPGSQTLAQEMFWPLWLFLWAALNALFLSADLFNLYVTLELLSLSAVALMAMAGQAAAMTAGMRYLLVSLLGSLAYLLGVTLLYAAYGTLDLAALGAVLTPGFVVWLAIILMTLGLLLKTGLFPLHFWLPPAHANAPAPVSVVLSALVIKAPFYLLLRLWFDVFTPAVTTAAAEVLGALGAGAIIWGSLIALRQARLKLLIAYSTVAQIGYLFLLFPLSTLTPAGSSAWAGGVYHAVTHALAKAAMFMSAGNIMQALGDDGMDKLDGIAERLPMTLFAFGLAGLTLMGLPPSGGFIAKWLLLSGALQAGLWWWAAVIIAGGLLSAGYLFLVLRRALARPPGPIRLNPITRGMELAALCLALIALVLGLTATLPLALLRIGAPFVE